MTLGALFLTSLAIGFSGAVTPGPLFVACVARTARDGFRGGWYVTVGHAALELLAVVGLTVGLGAVLVRPGVAPSVSLVGGLVLVWMGYATVRGALRGYISLPPLEEGALAGTGSAAAAAEGPPRRRDSLGQAGGALATGLAATVSGPYWVIWWATIGLSYITLATPLGPAGTAAFYLGHVSADFAWYAAVAAAVAGGRRLLTGRSYRALLVGCGLLLAVLGVLFAVKGALALGALG